MARPEIDRLEVGDATLVSPNDPKELYMKAIVYVAVPGSIFPDDIYGIRCQSRPETRMFKRVTIDNEACWRRLN